MTRSHTIEQNKVVTQKNTMARVYVKIGFFPNKWRHTRLPQKECGNCRQRRVSLALSLYLHIKLLIAYYEYKSVLCSCPFKEMPPLFMLLVMMMCLLFSLPHSSSSLLTRFSYSYLFHQMRCFLGKFFCCCLVRCSCCIGLYACLSGVFPLL